MTRSLKNYMGEKVQIIGTSSAGAVLPYNNNVNFSNEHNQLESVFLSYPIAELITTDFVRMESNPIQPDIVLTDPEEILKAAEKWVK